MADILRSLNALRAFESAARHGSFAKAAIELNVSHSVVSQHVKKLEGSLQTQLFTRYGNRIELTAEGQMLLPQVANAFQTLRDACDGVLGSALQKTVNISVEPAISSRWLRKRVTAFCADQPNIQVNLKPAWTPPTLGEQQINMVVHFEERMSHLGQSYYKKFLPINGFPACSPELFEKIKQANSSVANFQDFPLIHDNGREIWRKWYEKFAPKDAHWQHGKVYSDLALAIDAAVDGEGIILADEHICHRELQAGTLVKLDDRVILCTWYAVAIDKNHSKNSPVVQLQDWIISQGEK
ncbi:LysR family transcriptional regulator [Marinomonas sp. 15G1-11]|uniref:LysR family transcriptional regulator n=1 Tax=Marinomonas phaeophyticola TaxID=3004091 RepID=A0ABT4JZH4_9GAMM|nr:LysR family transcriptional regulator [Marinomonas sp. 15G1-11]MCZ2722924.1 LysR family transcriptional regulator [Marinomonas sp. 15G1-11]